MLPFLQGRMGTLGGGNTGYGGTIYAPSGGWATPGRQE
jgi:hypothetical protein